MNKLNDEIIKIPLSELDAVDISDQNVEKMARGFILGSTAIGRRKEVRELLEEKVIGRIGKKGKYLTDKLFELIDGVYILDKKSTNGKMSSVRYYQVPPNLQAIIYALDRVLGKPKQVSEHSEEKKGIILVEHVIKNMASQPYKNVKRRDGQSGEAGSGTISGSGQGSGQGSSSGGFGEGGNAGVSP